MDPLSLVTGGTLLALGYVLGRRQRKAPVEAICGCGHNRAVHDPTSTGCQSTVARQLWNGPNLNGFEYVPCPCRNYLGPKPVEELFTTQILPD